MDSTGEDPVRFVAGWYAGDISVVCESGEKRDNAFLTKGFLTPVSAEADVYHGHQSRRTCPQ